MQDEGALSRRPTVWLFIAAGTLILVAIVVTVAWMGPLPPKVVVMSTGTAGGTYDTFAQHYKAILARSGVVLRLVPSAGGVENLARLNDPHSGVMVAFVQSGLTSEAQSPDLEYSGRCSTNRSGSSPAKRMWGPGSRVYIVRRSRSDRRVVAHELSRCSSWLRTALIRPMRSCCRLPQHNRAMRC